MSFSKYFWGLVGFLYVDHRLNQQIEATRGVENAIRESTRSQSPEIAQEVQDPRPTESMDGYLARSLEADHRTDAKVLKIAQAEALEWRRFRQANESAVRRRAADDEAGFSS